MEQKQKIADVINHLSDHHAIFNEALKIKCVQEGTSEFFIIGENASGKSYLSKLTCSYFRQVFNNDVFNQGMGHRVSAKGIERIMVYGGQYEDEDSTGNITIATMLRILKQSGEYCEKGHVVVLDEPELGLAERFIKPLAELISTTANNKPTLRNGFAIVSHNRALLAEIEKFSEQKPTVFALGEFNKSYKEWLENGDESASLDELLQLKAKSSKINSSINKVKFKIKDMPEMK